MVRKRIHGLLLDGSQSSFPPPRSFRARSSYTDALHSEILPITDARLHEPFSKAEVHITSLDAHDSHAHLESTWTLRPVSQ